MYHDKIAPNTTSGKGSGGYKLKYAQDFEKDKGALKNTPYCRYQDRIMGENKRITDSNISKLKQD